MEMRGQREKIYNRQMGDRKFGDEGRRECGISKGGPDCTVEVYMSGVRGVSHSVTAGGQLQE